MANEVVKYNNRFNQVVFQRFTENELSLLMAICSKLKGKGTEPITLTFDQIKTLTNEKQHYTAKAYAEMIDNMYLKLLKLSYFYDDGKDVAGAFNLFQGYERSISEHEVTIAVTPQFLHMFNSLEREFTRFELEEFVNIRVKYPKLLYRQLKQWRTVGHYSVLLKEFRELMDVPDSYSTRDITKRIVVPSVNKLIELNEFRFLRYQYSFKGKTAIRIIFEWYPEKASKKTNPVSPVKTKTVLADVTAKLREKQIKDGTFFEEKPDPVEEIPGFPGYQFKNESENYPTDSESDWEDDNLPF